MHKDKSKILLKTPLGWAGIAVSEFGISRVFLPKRRKNSVERKLSSKSGARRSEHGRVASKSVLKEAKKLLRQYYSGKPVSFDLQLDMRHYTAFQQKVWKAAARIPYGETRSYGWVAKKIGNPKAVRAVGQAMGANPFPIIIP